MYKNYRWVLKPMFPDIAPFNFLKPIELLSNYYQSYYSQLYQRLKKLKFNKKYIELNSTDKDQMLLEYIKCRPNVSVITLWPKAKKKELINLLQKNGHLYAIKKITLSPKAAKSLLYQYYVDSDQQIESIGWNDEKSKDFYILIYEHLGKGKISDIIKNSDIHVNDYPHQSIEYAQILLNNQSLQFLEEQRLDRIKTKSQVLFNQYKNWLYQNIGLKDQIRFILYSSVVLFAYGIRENNDIDGYILEKPSNKDFEKKVDQYLLDEKSKNFLEYTDFVMKGSKKWADYWGKYLDCVSREAGIKNFDEVILNPNYHFYFMGMKFIPIKLEYIKRQYKSKSFAYANLYMIKELLGKNYQLPKILKKSKGRGENIDQAEFISKIQYFLRERYRIKLSTAEIKDIFGVE